MLAGGFFVFGAANKRERIENNAVHDGRSRTPRSRERGSTRVHRGRGALEPSSQTRSREHLHPSGSGGRVLSSGDDVFDRQRFVCNAALGAEGLSPRQDSVPSASYRYELQVSRDDCVSRFVREGNWRATDRSSQRRSAANRRESLHAGNAKVLRLAQDQEPSRRSGGGRIQRGVSAELVATKRSRARRKEYIRFATLTANGIPRISGRSCGICSIRGSTSPRASACSRFRTGRNSTFGCTSSRKTFRSCRSTTPKSVRWCLRNGSLVVIHDRSELQFGEEPRLVKCRMRSLGCVPCTGAIRSEADTLPKIIEEMISFRRSERENRAIDHDEEGSMELKKREGYF